MSVRLSALQSCLSCTAVLSRISSWAIRDLNRINVRESAVSIEVSWAESSGEEKKVVVFTRELSFRRKQGLPKLAGVIYRNYPQLLKSMEKANTEFNKTVDYLEEKAASGEVFIIAPSNRR